MNIRADMKPLFTDKILAAGDVYLDEKVVIHNVKLIQAEKDGQTYSFVSFPEKKKNDKWEPIIMIKDRLYGTSEATDGRTGCTVTKYSGCDERRQEAKEPVAISSLTVVKVEAWYR